MKPLIAFLAVMLLSIPFGGRAEAQTPEARGLEIAVEADRRDDGFGDFTATMNMTLKNRHGDSSTRNLRVKNLEVAGDGDKSLTIFDNPRDVKGTAFLTFTHKSGPDDQWLYLPALKRVKRISSSNKSGSFMGSEFAYEDLSSQEVEKYTYKWLRDEPCPETDYKELTCFVMERYPVDPNSGYTRQIAWIDTTEYRTVKIEYFDRKNAPMKTLTLKGYNRYLKKYWRADEMYVINSQTKKSTLLIWKDYKFKTGLRDRDFSKNALKRAR